MVKEIRPEKLEKILVILLAGLGDVVMASPVIKALREEFPQGRISLLLLKENMELGENCSYIDEVFGLHRGLSLRSFFSNLKTLLILRKKKYDLAINLYQIFSWFGAFKMWSVVLFIGANQSLGRNTDGKGFFFTIKVEDSINSKKHQVQSMLDVIRPLGETSWSDELEVWYDQNQETAIKGYLQSEGISLSDTIVGINPGSRRLSKRWPIENFTLLAQEIVNNYRAKIVITGTRKEWLLAEMIKKGVGVRAVNTCGKLNLPELVVLLKNCHLYITNDTGPMHIASALAIPLIVLEGGCPETTYPYQQKNVFLVKNDIPCRPCYDDRCKKDIWCLKSITVKQVMEKVEQVLRNKAKNAA